MKPSAFYAKAVVEVLRISEHRDKARWEVEEVFPGGGPV